MSLVEKGINIRETTDVDDVELKSAAHAITSLKENIVDEEAFDAVSVASEELEIDLEEKLSAVPENIKLSVEQKLALWYSWLPPTQSDAVEELGGNDSCLISVEGLILRLGCGGSLCGAFLDSPQFLGLLYQMEKFMSELNELGVVNIVLVFFDCFKGLLTHKHSALWAFREIFRLHCLTNHIVCVHFDNWSQPEYKNYIESRNPFLFMLEDGGDLLPARSVLAEAASDDEDKDSTMASKEEGSTASNGNDSRKRAPAEHGLYGLYSLMLDSTCRGINVGLFYQWEKNGRRLKTYVALPYHGVRALHSETLADVIDQLHEDSKILDDFHNSENILDIENWPKIDGKPLSFRLAVIRSCALESGCFDGSDADLEDQDDSEDQDGSKNATREVWASVFYKCLFVHDIILRSTHIEDRPIRLDHFKQVDSYNMTLEFFLINVVTTVSKMLEDTKSQELSARFLQTCSEDVADFFDERVFRSVLFCVASAWRSSEGKRTKFDAKFFGIDQERESFLNGIWKSISSKEPLFPINLEGIDESDFNLVQAIPDDTVKTPPMNLENFIGVLPIANNDFLTTLLKLDEKSLIPGAMHLDTVSTDGTELVAKFFDEEEVDYKTLLGKTDVPPSTSGDEETKNIQTWQRYSTFDNADFSVKFGQRKEENHPKYFNKYNGEEKERAIKKWKQRRLQESEAYARNINKFFGGLDRLHHPIVLIGGKASEGHPWHDEKFRDAIASDTSPTTKRVKGKVVPKMSQKKVSAKAADIIAKNQAKLAVKRAVREESMSVSLYAQLSHLFKKKVSRVRVFNEAFLEMLVGPRNASDTTVLEDFTAIRYILTLPDNRVTFLTAVAEKLMDPLEHTWKQRVIIESNQVADILRTIGLIFRFIHVTVDKHMKYMSSVQIRVFQNLLLMLGFKRSARATFDAWAIQQWKNKVANEAEVFLENDDKDKALTKKATKTIKPGASQNIKNAKPGKGTKLNKALAPRPSETEASDLQRKSFLRKLESTTLVKTSLRKFDFAVKPDQEATFQVKYLGPDMERTLGSQVDSRVAFLPDYWQKKLIDIVDAQESTLVVAPTASGKTFAAYYAMDCVLRYDNESCVIFISPTRALGLQVEAEVLARFSGKTYPTNSRTRLVGNLLENRSNNWDACQILITVPSCAETILQSLNPEIQQWRKCLKYAILDEIHCIGDEKQGKQWENLIQLLPCPFMALSATVGNELDFRAWLNNARSTKSDSEVHLIRHNERYADLQTLYYASGNHALYNLNPLLCLDYQRILNGTLTNDFHLTPTDALYAYEEFCRSLLAKKVEDSNETKDQKGITAHALDFIVTEYAPERFFVGCRAITKYQYRKWLVSILTIIERLAIAKVFTEADFNEIIRRMALAKPIGVGGPEAWWTEAQSYGISDPSGQISDTDEIAGTLGEEIDAQTGHEDCFDDPLQFLHLIRDLEARKMMPALVFNFNRAFASRLFYRVASKLILDHHNKFYGTPEAAIKTRLINKKRQDEYKAMIATREQAEKWKSLSKEQREEQGIDEQLFAELTGPLPPSPTDIAEDHDPDFFLTDKRMYISSQEEFDGVIKMCRLDDRVKSRQVPKILREALKRGIGLYHDALHREYRRAVELLFRMRYLRIVVSDTSLSMGINMPCKTTVFADDSSLLTPLLYRQTAGRAGRRGFDSLGHVVFWEFPFKKIRRLLCSKLPILSGSYPVRPTTVVRALLGAQASDSDIMNEVLSCQGAETTTFNPRILKKVDESRLNYAKIFTSPLYLVGAPELKKEYFQDNIRISLRFAVDLCRRVGLLGRDGTELGLTRIALSLVEEEPGNLFIVYAFVKGLMKNIVLANPDLPVVGGLELIDQSLLEVLAFAIKRREYTYSIVRRFELASIDTSMEEILLPPAQGSNTSPLLPPLSPEVEKLAVEFDRLVLNSVKCRAYGMSLLHREYNPAEGVLPISDINFSKAPEVPLKSDAEFSKWWSKKCMTPSEKLALSPFAALSGLSLMDISSADQLIASLRTFIFIERSMVPQLATKTVEIKVPREEDRKQLRLINSYVCDGLQHRSLRTLIECNDIPAAEAYFIIVALLESFKKYSYSLACQSGSKDMECPAGTSARVICKRTQNIVLSLESLFAQIRKLNG